MGVQIFATGGTISKRYDEISGELLFDEELPQKLLKRARSTACFDIKTLMLKDSLDMDDIDRDIIRRSVKNSDFDRIIILHGTDTMVQTAEKLSDIKEKTIVLTGAMIPYAFKNSDALFNVGMAAGVVTSFKSGVYIVMNAGVFKWDNVVKDKNKGIFKYKNL